MTASERIREARRSVISVARTYRNSTPVTRLPNNPAANAVTVAAVKAMRVLQVSA